MRQIPKLLVVFSFAVGLSACGDDSASSSSSRKPKARKNSKRKANKKAVVVPFSTYPKVDSDLRHKLREIDFTPDPSGKTNRDPFRSWVLSLAEEETEVIKVVDVCKEEGNGVAWEARGFSVRDLNLIGIVRRGRNYAQFADKGDAGSWIVREGDCVGQEKAIVEEVGIEFIKLIITPPTPSGRPAPPAQPQIISLHPGEEEIDISSIISKRIRDLR